MYYMRSRARALIICIYIYIVNIYIYLVYSRAASIQFNEYNVKGHDFNLFSIN